MHEVSQYRICEDVSTWMYDPDLLPLKKGLCLSGKIITFSAEVLSRTMGFQHSIDYVYPLGSDTIIAISLRDRSIAAYNYKANTIDSRYEAKSSDIWIDAVCLPLIFQKHDTYTIINSDAASIYILTDHVKVMKLSAVLLLEETYSFRKDYSVALPSVPKITRILPFRFKDTEQFSSVLDAFYLWVPSKRLIQKYSIFPNRSSAEPTPKLSTEFKLKFPIEFADSTPGSRGNEALSLCLDEIAQSVIVADAWNHCIFEYSLTEKSSRLLYSFSQKSETENGTDPNAALVSGPFFPLVLRPLDYVSDNLLSRFSLDAKKADASGILPRMLLAFQNARLRKIWQFPVSSAMWDLSGKTMESTLMKKSEDTEQRRGSAGRRGFCSLSAGSAGQLAVVTEVTVYLLFSGVSSAELEITEIDDVSKDS